MKVLVTGFDPFGGETINPAYEAVRLLPDDVVGAEIIRAELPTVFRQGAQILKNLIDQHKPDAVICVGQAGGRAAISVERVAVNLQDARIPDNAGNSPVDETIMADGKNAYFSNLPTRVMVQALQRNGIPAVLSYTAGTYVCNDVMYHLLYWIEKYYPQMRGGFIHVPYAATQAAGMAAPTASMPVAVISEGLRLAISSVVESLRA